MLPPSPKGFPPLSPTASSLGRAGQHHVRQENRRQSGARGEVRRNEGCLSPDARGSTFALRGEKPPPGAAEEKRRGRQVTTTTEER